VAVLVDQMLRGGVVKEFVSPWASPVVLVRKNVEALGFVLTTGDLRWRASDFRIDDLSSKVCCSLLVLS